MAQLSQYQLRQANVFHWDKHAVRANPQLKCRMYELYCTTFVPLAGTLKLLILLYYNYSYTCFTFQCAVVVMLPASGVEDAS
jgi:hypothetical protein